MKRSAFSAFVLCVLCVGMFIFANTWRAAASDCAKTSTGMIPLTDLGAGFYQGKQGGLYPGGSNTCPAAHEQAGLQIADSIVPRKWNGKPKAKGSIVLLSIGMSNTTMEFSTFKPMADSDPNKNPKLVIVDGAQRGMAANIITNPSDPKYQQFWQTVDDRLAQADVTPKQVQIAWVKQADISPTAHFPNDAIALQQELAEIAHILVARFPNIKIAYYSSRIYAGYASSLLNPEPFAYQSGFAVKWMIENQINGSTDLNYDPARAEVKAPWLAWGPYLWSDGLTPRSDGLTWDCSQFNDDGTHPAPGAGGAQEKVAHMLLDFFKSESTSTPWFLAKR
jgi:hypothetical protein